MKGLLKRWSFWCLLVLAALALFGTRLFDALPEAEVAATFSKPLWLDRSLPPTMDLELSGGHPAAELDWVFGAPSRFSLRVETALPAPSRFVEWTIPGGKTFRLTPLNRGVELDGRDIAF